MSGDVEEIKRRAVVITGLSGAGKTGALRAFEDAGYYCVDNLPPTMIPSVMEMTGRGADAPDGVAVVVDIRGRRYFGADFDEGVGVSLEGWERRVIFIEADEPTLVRRYKESRRPHPAARDGNILEGIRSERRDLAGLRERADVVVDTSNLSAEEVRKRFGRLAENLTGRMTLSVMSFGFKHGTPLDADMLLDARFLPNPHYDPELRPLTGEDERVREAVLASEDARKFLDHLEDMLAFLIPRYAAEGKTYFTLGVGCTGGRHRSVVISSEIARRLQPLARETGLSLYVRHRDIEGG